jgi:hypothetical protein
VLIFSWIILFLRSSGAVDAPARGRATDAAAAVAPTDAAGTIATDAPSTTKGPDAEASDPVLEPSI